MDATVTSSPSINDTAPVAEPEVYERYSVSESVRVAAAECLTMAVNPEVVPTRVLPINVVRSSANPP